MLIKIDRKAITAIPKEPYQREHLEKHLEDIVEQAPTAFLGMDVLLIGRQVRTDRGIIDLLGLDKSGNTVIIELKRDESPREIVSQAISYRSHFRRQVDLEELNRIAEGYFGQESDGSLLIRKKFKERFGRFPSELNKKQVIVLVAEHFSEDVLADLQEIADHICIEFAYFRSAVGEEFIAATRSSEIDLSKEESPTRADMCHEFDPFFAEVVERVKKMVEKPVATFTNTEAHTRQTQWIRFHWGHTNVHVGIFAKQRRDGALISVYFCNYALDPRVAEKLKAQDASLREALSIVDGQDDYDPEKRTSIDKLIGKLSAGERGKMTANTAKAVSAFLSTLKPALGDLL